MIGRPARVWTLAEDDALASGYQRGDTAATIAARLCVDLTMVHNRARKLGIRHRHRTRSLAERFADHVSPEPNSGCWLWVSSTDRNDYGRMLVSGRRVMQASHVSLMLAGETIPPGANVYRTCGLPACVNPDHLLLSRKP